MLRITLDQFREVYKDTDILKYEDIFYSKPTSDKELIEKYLTSKLWRLNNLYTVINKRGRRVKFNMRFAQHKVYAASLRHARVIVLKSRQQGISTLWLVSFFDDCVFNRDLSSGLMAQGTDEAEKLLTRTKILWEELDPSIKKFLNLDIEKNNTKEFSFTNGSSIFIRYSFRSATIHRLHISELAKTANRNPDRAKETKTGTLQAIATGNTVVIESTAEGDNMYKKMWDSAVSYSGNLSDKDFMPVFLSWVEDSDCALDTYQESDARAIKYFKDTESQLNVTLTQQQKNFWIAQYRELGNDIFAEYPATPEEAFLKSRDGTYFARLYLNLIRSRNREIHNLYDSNLPVQVAVDLGRNDFFVLVFFQTFTDGFRIINDYKNTGEGIKHYCEVMDELQSQLGYSITDIILPHDAMVRELTSDETREQAFWKYGYKNTTIVERTKDINNDRELVRQAMENMYVDPQAEYIIKCFLNYTKEWDERRGVWRDSHEHNEYSHGADAIRQMVRGGKSYVTQNERNRRYVQNRWKSGVDV